MKMNRRAYMTSFIFGLIGLFIVLLVLVTLLPVKYGDMDVGEAVSTLNKTQYIILKNFQSQEFGEEGVGIITSVILRFIDFLVYSAFEIAKLAVVVGNEWFGTRGIWLLIWLVILGLLAPVALILFKFLIIIVILIYDFYQSRKEKRAIKKLKGGNRI